MKQKVVHAGDSNNITRTPLYEAMKQILQFLIETQKSYSITGLAREIGLHRNTVQKSIELLEYLEKEWLEEYRLKLQEVDKRKFILLERRTGLLSYPEEIQRFIIRTKYYPTSSQEEYLLVHLYLKDATSSKKAISIPNGDGKYNEVMIKRLLKQGQIEENREDKLYLSDEGTMVAKGALQIYPELKEEK